MSNYELQTRLNRASLSSANAQQDLATILLALRATAAQDWIIKEVGDLIAHRFDKDVGAISSNVQSLVLAFNFFKGLFDRTLSPAEIAAGLAHLVDRLEPICEAALGMPHAKAKSRIAHIGRKVSGHNGIVVLFKYPLNSTDEGLVRSLFSVDYGGELFNENELYGQFLSACRARDLDTRICESSSHLKRMLTLYVISLFHGLTIKAGDISCGLMGGHETPPGQTRSIAVFAHYIWDGIPCYLPVFRTYTSPEGNCDSTLMYLEGNLDFWEAFPLEISPHGILQLLEP
ncbi:hypothetical protein Rleg4DRAFT_2022 [Rhizobium leguminosarum bv. trifolii WSM2297]|uniref:Uncharacterized protein n=1 Tax=Rhizobium leguminosarum bv. trifolii WSM2297 TaxID=754762 RepID=J0W3T9_RHILT|nr:hypothetical protein [Rhizobium leguminosarum]EJC80396.1 hypothetical protein Rleg4DRAFT_2022 [Rhizobium leguminosarum bv. trifolii WSM2297]